MLGTQKMSNSNKGYHPIISFNFLKSYLIHMRPYLLFVSGAGGLAGMAFTSPAINYFIFFLEFLPFFLGYGFGQALTDCTQIDTDSISSPYRPLTQGEVSVKSVAIVSLTGLVAIAICLYYLNPSNIIFIILSIGGLSTYTYFKKNFWFAGPFYNGWIVMLLPLMGILATNDGGIVMLFQLPVLFLALLTLFSYANFVLIGYLKDISADRQTNYKTFPVVFGWEKTVLVGDLFLIISVISCFHLINATSILSLSYFMLGTVIAVFGQLFAHFTGNKTEENSSFPIAATVRSFIFWHLAIVASYKPEWSFFTMLFYVMFEMTLYFRPEKNQI